MSWNEFNTLAGFCACVCLAVTSFVAAVALAEQCFTQSDFGAGISSAIMLVVATLCACAAYLIGGDE